MCAPFDIHTLKLVINIQFSNFDKNIYFFVFSTKISNTSCETIVFWKGKQLEDTNAKLDAQTKDFLEITVTIHSSQLKGQGFELFFLQIILFEKIFDNKQLRYCIV